MSTPLFLASVTNSVVLSTLKAHWSVCFHAIFNHGVNKYNSSKGRIYTCTWIHNIMYNASKILVEVYINLQERVNQLQYAPSPGWGFDIKVGISLSATPSGMRF